VAYEFNGLSKRKKCNRDLILCISCLLDVEMRALHSEVADECELAGVFIMLFRISPFMQCVIYLFVNVKGLQSFKDKSARQIKLLSPKRTN
jgi:hypothetical protein